MITRPQILTFLIKEPELTQFFFFFLTQYNIIGMLWICRMQIEKFLKGMLRLTFLQAIVELETPDLHTVTLRMRKM